MLISSSALAVVRFNDSSSNYESPKQSINLKRVLENGVSIFLQNPISRTVKSDRVVHMGKLKSAKSDNLEKTVIVTEVVDLKPDRGSGGGDDGNGKFPPGNGGGGGGDDGGGDEDDDDEKEFGPLMKFEEVMKVAETHGVNLPSDMLEAAKATGLRKLILSRYLELQVNIITSMCKCRNYFNFYHIKVKFIYRAQVGH